MTQIGLVLHLQADLSAKNRGHLALLNLVDRRLVGHPAKRQDRLVAGLLEGANRSHKNRQGLLAHLALLNLVGHHQGKVLEE